MTILKVGDKVQSRDGTKKGVVICTDFENRGWNTLIRIINPKEDANDVVWYRLPDGRFTSQGERGNDVILQPVEKIVYRKLFKDTSVGYAEYVKTPSAYPDRWIGWLKYTMIDDKITNVEFIDKNTPPS